MSPVRLEGPRLPRVPTMLPRKLTWPFILAVTIVCAHFSNSFWELTKLANGYFNAYGNAVRKDSVDYVLHLGDYIYETKKGVVGRDERAVRPEREIFSLYDYRTRLGHV